MKKQVIQPIKIVDDFFEAPTIVRHNALKQEFIKQDNEIFPGLRTKTIDQINPNFFERSLSKLITHVTFKQHFTFMHSEYQLVDETNNGRTGELRQIVGDYNVAGIIFLNPEPVEKSGITFFNEVNDSLVPSVAIENKFNRLVMFNPMHLHKIEKFIGDTKETSSLFINFYGAAI